MTNVGAAKEVQKKKKKVTEVEIQKGEGGFQME